jgi:hypothetical protein
MLEIECPISFHILLLILDFFLCLPTLYKLIRGKSDWINPWNLFVFYFFTNYVIVPALLLWRKELYFPFTPSTSLALLKVQIASLFLFICVFLGYRSNLAKSFNFKKLFVPIHDLDFNKLPLIAFILLGIGLFSALLFIRAAGGLGAWLAQLYGRALFTRERPYTQLLVEGVRFSIAGAIIYSVYAFKKMLDTPRVVRRVRFWVGLIIVLLIAALTNSIVVSRSQLLLSFIFVVIIYHIIYRRIRFVWVLIIYFFLPLIGPIFKVYQPLQVMASAVGLTQPPEIKGVNIWENYYRHCIGYWGSIETDMTILWETSAQEYALGLTYGYFFLNVIPRPLFPEQFRYFLDISATSKLWEIAYHQKGAFEKIMEAKASPAITQLGEAWMNFSFLGIFLVFPIIGFLMRIVWQLYLQKERYPEIVFLYPLLLYFSLNITFGDFSYHTTFMLSILLPLFLGLWLAKKKY